MDDEGDVAKNINITPTILLKVAHTMTNKTLGRQTEKEKFIRLH